VLISKLFDLELNTMLNKLQPNKLFMVVFLTALIVGGAAGVIGGLLVGSQTVQIENGVPTIIKQNSDDSTPETIVISTDSDTTRVVEQATPGVVSVIVTKELENVRRGTFQSPFGDLFPRFPDFNFFFGQPLEPDPSAGSGQGEPEERQVGAGTGFVVSSERGLIVTNKHVVDDVEASYTVITNSGEEFEAEVLARDPVLDLAILKVDPSDYDLHELELADSDAIKIGQTVIAIGNALGEFSNTVTRGVVSGIGRTITASGSGGGGVIEEAIQTDAAISPGNSGGPLLDLNGKVVGVNTAVSNRGENIGFAIPINEAKRIIDSIEKHGRIVRPWLGVRYMMLNERVATLNNLDVNEGALLIRGDSREELAVIPGSPADKAGLEENDIILAVNGTKIEPGKSLARILAKYTPGETVTLKVLHDGEEKEVQVTLEEFEE
jgi:serine protease Do